VKSSAFIVNALGGFGNNCLRPRRCGTPHYDNAVLPDR
jgi:hypothetical protein